MRLGVVALDQVRVVTVHHPHEIGEIGRGAGVQPIAKPLRRRREAGEQIGDFDRDSVKQAGREALLRS